MTVSLIWAQAANGVIGDRGTLPWHLPEDLALFRSRTLGQTVLMGRRTWESLPEHVRPLPGRRNVVLSRQAGWRAPGAEVAESVAAGIESAASDVWVIGGASVYQAALPAADALVVTELEQECVGDTFAPALGPEWHPTEADPSTGWYESRSGLRYRVITYARDKAFSTSES